MKAYKITASYEDSNGVRVASDIAETLGDSYGMTYLTEDAANQAAEDLQNDLGDVDPSTVYSVEDFEFTGFVEGEKYDAESVSGAGFSIDDDGYHIGDYFDAYGRYLGPDEHGIEPTHSGQ